MMAALVLITPARFNDSSHDYLTWFLGVMTGGLLGLYVLARDDVPEWIHRHLVGGEGERRTARELQSLADRGYIIRHDLPRAQSNWDHIVVGPAGVFLIDSKNLGGRASVDGDEVRITRGYESRDDYTESLGSRIRGQAYGLHREIESATSLRPWVQGIICFWNPFDEGMYEHDRAVFVHGTCLVKWIDSQPTKLTGANLRTVLRYLGMQEQKATSV